MNRRFMLIELFYKINGDDNVKFFCFKLLEQKGEEKDFEGEVMDFKVEIENNGLNIKNEKFKVSFDFNFSIGNKGSRIVLMDQFVEYKLEEKKKESVGELVKLEKENIFDGESVIEQILKLKVR